MDNIDIIEHFGDMVAPIETITCRSARNINPLTYLRDFYCNMFIHDIIEDTLASDKYPLSSSLNYDLSPSFKASVLNVSTHYVPQFYHHSVKHPKWCDAMRLELQAMEQNNPWSVVPLPSDKQSTCRRWIYKIKFT